MSLLTIILVLVAAGVVLWLINKAPFIDASIKPFIFWMVIIVVVIWLLKASGLLASLSSVTI